MSVLFCQPYQSPIEPTFYMALLARSGILCVQQYQRKSRLMISKHAEALYRLASDLLRSDGYEQMLDTIVRHSLQLLGADRGFLVLMQGGTLDFKVCRNWSREELESGKEPISRSILQEVLANKSPLLVEDALSDERFGKKESVVSMQLRSVLAAPILLSDEPVGVLYLESRTPENLFEEEQLALFEEILSITARPIANGLRQILLAERVSLLENELAAKTSFPGIVTADPGFSRLLETVAQVARSSIPVLIQGQSGTGKELIARSLHVNSNRTKKPFLTINCSAISANLLESELFGYVKGAFTGANQNKTGLIAAAHQGTLFLDEIGELPKELQAKLLRTIQFGEVLPVGATQPQMVDVRFVAATNRDLEVEVKEGRFREDLLYRLNAVTLSLPALRERRGDILLLFHHFLKEAARREEKPAPVLSPRVERALEAYHWPGNIRELENEAKRLVALTPTGAIITTESLSPRVMTTTETITLDAVQEKEREVLELHLRLSQGNKTHAAKSLGLTREGLRKKMKRYNLA
jgi:Nif-specific regulatory protein